MSSSRRVTFPADSTGSLIPPVTRLTDAADFGDALLRSLGNAIADATSKPIYLQIIISYRRKIEIKQIRFLNVEEFAELARVEPRTVHGWLQRGIAPTPYRPPGSRCILFEMNEAIAWIKNNSSSGDI
jgi:hypothetical protein